MHPNLPFLPVTADLRRICARRNLAILDSSSHAQRTAMGVAVSATWQSCAPLRFSFEPAGTTNGLSNDWTIVRPFKHGQIFSFN